ncbi:hypothetical protein RhiirA1_451049 [Rhizophagus irregularis]|uniref:Uncharacterized protein n=1 Tax=Rhizophagus irregularis TaxID=588596 RepID=A0A2N0SDE7_9GLOM|nr:hypothetical protein RhiirA1_451049 [Rhizophagus irregularis]CAB4464207.1 unnamed protein product [Rhizophagus irregularis]
MKINKFKSGQNVESWELSYDNDICKKCNEITCIGCEEPLMSKIKRLYCKIKNNLLIYKKDEKYKYEWDCSDDNNDWGDCSDDNNDWGCSDDNNDWGCSDDNNEWGFSNDNNEWGCSDDDNEWDCSDDNNEWDCGDDYDGKIELRNMGKIFEKIMLKSINEIIFINNLQCENNDVIDVPLEIIRYSQRKINPLFKGRGLIRKSIYETVNELKNKEIKYGNELPIIEICVYEGKVWSMDNRRLYCLKEVFDGKEIIKCKNRKVNNNFLRKREQALIENEEKDHDWYDIKIDIYSKGIFFNDSYY